MEEAILNLVVGTGFSWIVLVAVVAIGQKIADLSVPPWPEGLWKLAVIALVANAITVGIGLLIPFIGQIVALVAFWWLMHRWFDVTFLGAIVLVVISWIVRAVLMLLVLGALAAS